MTSNIYTGDDGGEWSLTTNWSLGHVPTNSEIAAITGATAPSVGPTLPATVGGYIFSPTASSFAQNDVTFDGQVEFAAGAAIVVGIAGDLAQVCTAYLGPTTFGSGCTITIQGSAGADSLVFGGAITFRDASVDGVLSNGGNYSGTVIFQDASMAGNPGTTTISTGGAVTFNGQANFDGLSTAAGCLLTWNSNGTDSIGSPIDCEGPVVLHQDMLFDLGEGVVDNTVQFNGIVSSVNGKTIKIKMGNTIAVYPVSAGGLVRVIPNGGVG